MSESFGRGESALFLQNPELAAAARRQRLAQGLLEQAVKPRNVGGHAGGLAQMGQALIAGYMGYKEDERIRGIADAQRAREEEEVRALMGGGMPAAAPEGQAPAAESALATPPGSLPPPIPLGAEAPPMAQALMNPPGQPGQPAQGGAAQGMPMPPPVPAGGAAQPGGGVNMQAIIAGMSSSSPRVRATAQMLFQQARDQEERALRLQDREEERRFRLQLAGASRAPAAPGREPQGSFTPANAAAMLADMASAYEAGTLTPEQANRYEIAASMMQRPQSYLDQQTGQMVTVPAMTFPEPIQRALAAGQARRAGGAAGAGATVPTAAAAPMPGAGMALPAMPQDNLAGLEDYYRALPTSAAPVAPVAPRAGNDATVVPPMIGEQNRIPLSTGGNMTVTQVRPERPSSQATEAVRTAEVGTGRVLDAINNFRQALEPFRGRTGIQAFNPRDPQGQKLESAYQLLKMAMRDESLLNTGVLQPGENVMIEQMLRSPTSLAGLIANVDTYNAMLDEFAGFATRGANRVRASAGMPPIDWNAPRSGVTPDLRNNPASVGGARPPLSSFQR
jgi:hypothetical protein